MPRLTSAILATSLVLAAGGASAATIDFEGFSNGALVQSFTFDGITATVTAQGGANEARVFDTSLSGTADDDLEAPFTGPGTSTNPGNILIVQEGGNSAIPDDWSRGGTITLSFSGLVNFDAFDAFDDTTVTVTSTDLANSFVLTSPNNRGTASASGIGFFGITDLTFDLDGSGGIDNLELSAATNVVDGAVPLPAGLPLLLAGLGGLAALRRRRG